VSETVADIVRNGRGERRGRGAAAVDRLPPHDIQMEMGALSCCLTDPAAVDACIEQFRQFGRSVFYDARHQVIFDVLMELREAHLPIELLSVMDRLKARNLFDQVGGIAYLSELQDAAPSAANLSYYNGRLLEKCQLRRAITLCTELVGRMYEHDGEAATLLTECETEFAKLTENALGEPEEKHIKQVMQGVLADMEQWHYARGSQQLRGLPMGRPGDYIDKVLMGVRNCDYVTIAARPGDGKSSFAMNIVEFLAKDYVWYEKTGDTVITPEGVEVQKTVERKGIPIGVFTLEMDNESLGYRLMFGRAGVDEARFNQGFMQKGDMERLVQAAGELVSTNIYLDDTPGQTIGRIAAKARRMARQYGIKLFVLDYVQLPTSDNPRDDERTRLDKISKKIMSLKKQLGVPWLVLAQLNRNIETAERDRAPVLSDLAGCASMEHDSDKVIILKKTARRELDKEPEGGGMCQAEMLERIASQNNWAWSQMPSRVDAWVVKNRRGPRGKVELIFQNNLCRFEDFHAFKVRHGIEERKAGESKHALPTNEELGI